MGIKIGSKGGGSSYEPITPGTYLAVINYVVLIGTHETTYDNKTWDRTQVILGYQIPAIEKEDKDGNKYRASIKQYYTASTDERSKLYPVITSALGHELAEEDSEDFDLASLAGKTVQITVINKTKKTGEIGDAVSVVAAALDGTPDIIAEGDTTIFLFDQEANGDISIPKGVMGKILEKIKESQEWHELSGAPQTPKATTNPPVKQESSKETTVPTQVPGDEQGEETEEEDPDAKLNALLASLPDDIDPKIKEDLIARMKKVG